MLNLCRDDVIPFLPQGKEDSFDGMIVGLAPSTGKYDLRSDGIGADLPPAFEHSQQLLWQGLLPNEDLRGCQSVG